MTGEREVVAEAAFTAKMLLLATLPSLPSTLSRPPKKERQERR